MEGERPSSTEVAVVCRELGKDGFGGGEREERGEEVFLWFKPYRSPLLGASIVIFFFF